MIHFNFLEQCYFTEPQRTKRWIKKVIEKHGKKLGEINYIFVNDKRLLNINHEFLQHDYYTDIITFDYVEGNKISGDIYISVDRLKENSKKYSVTFYNEMLRVMIHGVLHLLGYEDHSEEEQNIMRRKEREALDVF